MIIHVKKKRYDMAIATRHFPQRSTGAPASAELDVVVKRQWPPVGDGMGEDNMNLSCSFHLMLDQDTTKE